MTHALTDGTVPDVIEQPSTDSDGARIYGTTLPPSKKIPVKVRFWREDDPEVWAAAGHPHAVFPTTYEELLRLTDGTAAEVGEAQP